MRVQGVQEDYSNKQEANLPGESDDGKKESGKDHSNAESILPGINYETVYGLLCDI